MFEIKGSWILFISEVSKKEDNGNDMKDNGAGRLYIILYHYLYFWLDVVIFFCLDIFSSRLDVWNIHCFLYCFNWLPC